MISGLIEIFFDFLYFQLHDVMLHQHFLFLLSDFIQILDGHIVLEREFLNLRVQLLLRGLNVDQSIIDCSQVVIELLYALIQDLILFLHILVLFGRLLNVLL